MIRTLIEITSETTWDHNKQLADTLDKLGFEPKDSAENVRFMGDLFRELNDRGLEPQMLVKAQREKRGAT